jgi:hypothetical protein
LSIQTIGDIEFLYALWRDVLRHRDLQKLREALLSFYTPFGVTLFGTGNYAWNEFGIEFLYALWRDVLRHHEVK